MLSHANCSMVSGLAKYLKYLRHFVTSCMTMEVNSGLKKWLGEKEFDVNSWCSILKDLASSVEDLKFVDDKDIRKVFFCFFIIISDRGNSKSNSCSIYKRDELVERRGEEFSKISQIYSIKGRRKVGKNRIRSVWYSCYFILVFRGGL